MSDSLEFGEGITPDQRAGEYVLGLLRGMARAQFEAEMDREPALARAVAFWEDRLAPLALAAAPEIMPSPAMWCMIEASIRPAEPPVSWGDRVAALWNNVGVWRGIGVLAIAAALVLAIIHPGSGPAPQPSMVALLNQGTTPLFTVSLRENGSAQILPLSHVAPPAGKVWQLWAVAKGVKPVPIGFLQSGPTNLPAGDIPATLRKPGVLIAVTVEQPGGSPTGTPTMPIMFDGPLTSVQATSVQG
jgi:anti-sigma-K factor RskA